ncbi:hypothetical protein evm_002638 [Chilo suppressalis]|nr:hypothetical protein evm_002638 [Chilo suppressalis]
MEPATLSCMSVTERLAALMPCDDSSCCCMPRRTTVIVISIINFFGCLMDLMTSDTCMSTYCEGRRLVDSVRKVLVTLFQMANLLLLLASIFENAFLVDIYVWYTLGYIVMGFIVTIYEFLVKMKRLGARRSLLTFVPEVIFFFVHYTVDFELICGASNDPHCEHDQRPQHEFLTVPYSIVIIKGDGMEGGSQSPADSKYL